MQQTSPSNQSAVLPTIYSIRKFIDSGTRSAWIREETMSIFVRVSNRYVDGDYHQMLEIASVVVQGPLRGQGIFSGLLRYLEAKQSFDGIYVEHVVNERLAAFLCRQDYLPGSYPDDFYKLHPQES